MADVAEAEALQGHSAQQSHLAFPPRLQPCCFPALRPFLSHMLHQVHIHFSFPTSSWKKNPVLVETGYYYYLQEKQKILILSELGVNNGQGEGKQRPHCSTAILCSPYKYRRSESLVPFLQAGKHSGEGGTLFQEGQRQNPLCAAGSPGYLKQCFWDMEISIWVNHCFPRIKKRKWKMFPIPQASNFSHTTLIWFQLQGRCLVRYSPAQIQVNCFLRRGQEKQCCQGCLQHPQGPTSEQRHLPWQATERELPATLSVPQHTLLSRE